MRPTFVLGIALLLAACGDDSTTDTTTSSTTGATTANGTSASSSASTGGMGGNGGSGGSIPSVGFDGHVVEDGSSMPVEGADVCIYAHPEIACAKSDMTGKFTLPIPDNADTGVQVSKTGYAGTLVAVRTVGQPWTGVVVPLQPVAGVSSFYAAGPTPYPDAGKGFLAVHFTNDAGTGLASAKTTLVPSGGAGPFYANAAGTAPDASLTATTVSGLVRYGALTPGKIEVDATCNGQFAQGNYFGWPTADLAKIEVPIVDGFETRLGFTCI